jgi:hypothetical protein
MRSGEGEGGWASVGHWLDVVRSRARKWAVFRATDFQTRAPELCIVQQTARITIIIMKLGHRGIRRHYARATYGVV